MFLFSCLTCSGLTTIEPQDIYIENRYITCWTRVQIIKVWTSIRCSLQINRLYCKSLLVSHSGRICLPILQDPDYRKNNHDRHFYLAFFSHHCGCLLILACTPVSISIELKSVCICGIFLSSRTYSTCIFVGYLQQFCLTPSHMQTSNRYLVQPNGHIKYVNTSGYWGPMRHTF